MNTNGTIHTLRHPRYGSVEFRLDGKPKDPDERKYWIHSVAICWNPPSELNATADTQIAVRLNPPFRDAYRGTDIRFHILRHPDSEDHIEYSEEYARCVWLGLVENGDGWNRGD
jgi:hypothetical protein